MRQYQFNLDMLRDYQKATIEALDKYPFSPKPGTKYYEKFGSQMAAVVYHGTSSGKTLEMLIHAFRRAKDGKKAMIAAPNQITANRFPTEYTNLKDKIFLGPDFPNTIPVIDGRSRQAELNFALKQNDVIVISNQLLLNKLREVPELFHEIKVIICEEGHHIAAEEWKRIIEFFPDAEITFWTGTPSRFDKKPLPKTPYAIEDLGDSRIKYTLLDIADITGIKASRFTRKDADERGFIKKTKVVCLDQEGAMVPLPDGSRLKYETLTEAKADLYDKGYRLDVYRQPDALLKWFTKLKELYEERVVKKYGALGKFTAIVKALTTDDVDFFLPFAKQAGWNAVPYYATIDPIREKEMENNLRRFESSSDSCNMIVQIAKMKEGYSNNYVAMTFCLHNMESFPDCEQFNARGIRLIPGILPLNQPRLIAVCIDIGQNPKLYQKFEQLETEMHFITKEVEEPGGDRGPNVMKDKLLMDDAGTTFISYGKLEEESGVDQLIRMLEQGDTKEVIEILKAHKKSTFVEPKTEVTAKPYTTDEAKEDRDEVSRQIMSYLAKLTFRNDIPLEDLVPVKEERGPLLGEAAQGAINHFYPSLRKGLKNPRLDPKDVQDMRASYRKEPKKFWAKAEQILNRRMEQLSLI